MLCARVYNIYIHPALFMVFVKRAAIALAINNLFRLTNTHWAKFAVVVVQIFAHNDINGHVLAWRKFGACLSQHDINKTS